MNETLEREMTERMERHAASSAIGINRRVTLALATLDDDGWREFATNDPEALLEVIVRVRGFAAHAVGMVEVANMVIVRAEASLGNVVPIR